MGLCNRAAIGLETDEHTTLARTRAQHVGQVLRKDQAAALVSCTVTLGAANRIWLAAKASISRRNA